MGSARTKSPNAAGIVTTAVSRRPRDRNVRTPAASPVAHRSLIPGSKAVMIETAKIAWGSWNTVNAVV